ncbi:arf-GAP with ANK repeat and PH domain-containing protein cnt-1-like [Vitis riparia]|uniref:arf-GAP with ANK repeat and PH domain-containing protein cnt-1-like n=1 Tax=Vitis riparia TaxID=96939 RepID=UPI00155A23B9|nr:arf-GAP with ANK repeat and PH domain-containing protein cnt-1-like [Vitis riparia]
MRTLFISEDLWELVDKGYVEEEIPGDAMRDVRKNDAKVAAHDGDGSQTDIPVMDDSVYKAAAKGDIEVLKTIPESEFHAQLTPKHNTILHIASEFGQTECVKWILTLPACSSLLRCPNLNRDTPLHLAAREGHLKMWWSH